MARYNGSNPKDWALGTSSSMLRPATEEKVAGCVEAGMTHIEVVLPGSEADPFAAGAAVREWADRHGMHVQSVHLPYGWAWDVSQPDAAAREKAIKQHEELMERSAPWQPKTAIIHPSYEPIPDDDRADRLAWCRESLGRLSDFAFRHGMTLAVECLPRTCLGNTSDEITFFLEGNDRLGVCCDVNHLLKETPQAFIDQVGERIVATHISDYDGLDEKHWAPGMGIIDWPAVVNALARHNFSGPFMFEVRATPNVGAPELVAWWGELLGRLDG